MLNYRLEKLNKKLKEGIEIRHNNDNKIQSLKQTKKKLKVQLKSVEKKMFLFEKSINDNRDISYSNEDLTDTERIFTLQSELEEIDNSNYTESSLLQFHVGDTVDIPGLKITRNSGEEFFKLVKNK